MIKREERSDPKSCLNQAKENEMLFVLLGRDAAAPATIRFWVNERIILGKNISGDKQTTDALRCADEIEKQLREKETISDLRDTLAVRDSEIAHLKDMLAGNSWPERFGCWQALGFPENQEGNLIEAIRTLRLEVDSLKNKIATRAIVLEEARAAVCVCSSYPASTVCMSCRVIEKLKAKA